MPESTAKPKVRTRPRPNPSPAKVATDAVLDVAKAPVAVTRALMPDGRSVAAYAALAGVALLGLIEWPVAAAAGAGWLASRLWESPQPAAADTAPSP